MKNERSIKEKKRTHAGRRFGGFVGCFCSEEQFKADQMISSSTSLVNADYSTGVSASQDGEVKRKHDTGNIEEAETSLRESSSLNYEEARALLGRYEYQKGNTEAALHVFEGIDINAVSTKMKITISKIGEPVKRRSQTFGAPPMSIHAVSLLLEAIFLKAKTLEALGRYREAAQSCSVVLDILEASLPAGLPKNFAADSKLQETLSKAVELLPELWKLADSPGEAILSYRRSLLLDWNLDVQTTARIQKEFAIFLLYSGAEASAPSLRSQMGTKFVPRNNIEEAILLFMVLLRKVSLRKIEWDPSVLDHLSYALSVSGGLTSLANQVEELLPGSLERKDCWDILALCYYGEGDDSSAFGLLRKLLSHTEDPTSVPALLLASKICSKNPKYAEDGVSFAHRAIEHLQGGCNLLIGAAKCLLGVSLSSSSRSAVGDPDRVRRQSESLESLEYAAQITGMEDPVIVYHLCVEYAEQRKLDSAFKYAVLLLKLESGSDFERWLLLARILSALKRFADAENIIDAGLEQTGKWDQVELLITKAKLQTAQGQVQLAIETYRLLLAVFQVQGKSFGSGKNFKDGLRHNRRLELETWLDLASIYIGLSRLRDAEICLSKSEEITHHSAVRWHTIGLLQEAKGQQREALKAFERALAIDPSHAPSLVSTAVVLRRVGTVSPAIVRNFLTEAIHHDRMNASAWHNLGLLYKEVVVGSALEAAECFEAALSLEETAPVEPFR